MKAFLSRNRCHRTTVVPAGNRIDEQSPNQLNLVFGIAAGSSVPARENDATIYYHMYYVEQAKTFISRAHRNHFAKDFNSLRLRYPDSSSSHACASNAKMSLGFQSDIFVTSNRQTIAPVAQNMTHDAHKAIATIVLTQFRVYIEMRCCKAHTQKPQRNHIADHYKLYAVNANESRYNVQHALRNGNYDTGSAEPIEK